MRFILALVAFLLTGCTYILGPSSDTTKNTSTVALLINNEEYKDGKHFIYSTQKGVEELKEVLEGLNIKVLPIKKDISYEGLVEAFNELNNTILDKEHTNAFIYFAGHGVSDENLSGTYIEMIGEKNNYVEMSVLYRFIKDIKARATIVSIDACRNFKEENNLSNKIKFIEAPPKELYVNYATRLSETANGAIPYEEKSYYLKSFLNHVEKEISAREVFELVRSDVNKEESSQFTVSHDGLDKSFRFKKHKNPPLYTSP